MKPMCVHPSYCVLFGELCILYQSDQPGGRFGDDKKIRADDSGGGPDDDDSLAPDGGPPHDDTKYRPR